MLQYYIFLLISFLGLLTGWCLARIAWEEVDMYNLFLEGLKVICVLGAFSLAFIHTRDIVLSVMVLIVYGLFYFTKRHRGAYAILPITLWMVFPSQYAPYLASILLLYGFSEGSLQAFEQGSKGKELNGLLTILRKNYWYLVVGVILGIAL